MREETVMEVEEIDVIEMELKYCERCGGLWLRTRGTAEVYCPPCAPKMQEHANSQKRRGQLRMTVKGDAEIRGRGEELSFLWEDGGHA
jgi:hypothetical protein